MLYVAGLYQCVCRWWLYYKALPQSGRILVSMESPTLGLDSAHVERGQFLTSLSFTSLAINKEDQSTHACEVLWESTDSVCKAKHVA